MYYNLTFEHPVRWIIFGPSSSGKSTFVLNFLKNDQHFYDCGFDRIVYYSDGIFLSTELSVGVQVLGTA
jgi:AAA+ ATPase superfamily predicted ATPase